MRVPPGGPPVPIELLRLRSAVNVFRAMLRDVDIWAEQAADVNRLVQPDFAAQLDGLRDELRAAERAQEMGTPAALGRVLAEMLGECGGEQS